MSAASTSKSAAISMESAVRQRQTYRLTHTMRSIACHKCRLEGILPKCMEVCVCVRPKIDRDWHMFCFCRCSRRRDGIELHDGGPANRTSCVLELYGRHIALSGRTINENTKRMASFEYSFENEQCSRWIASWCSMQTLLSEPRNDSFESNLNSNVFNLNVCVCQTIDEHTQKQTEQFWAGRNPKIALLLRHRQREEERESTRGKQTPRYIEHTTAFANPSIISSVATNDKIKVDKHICDRPLMLVFSPFYTN